MIQYLPEIPTEAVTRSCRITASVRRRDSITYHLVIDNDRTREKNPVNRDEMRGVPSPRPITVRTCLQPGVLVTVLSVPDCHYLFIKEMQYGNSPQTSRHLPLAPLTR